METQKWISSKSPQGTISLSFSPYFSFFSLFSLFFYLSLSLTHTHTLYSCSSLNCLLRALIDFVDKWHVALVAGKCSLEEEEMAVQSRRNMRLSAMLCQPSQQTFNTILLFYEGLSSISNLTISLEFDSVRNSYVYQKKLNLKTEIYAVNCWDWLFGLLVNHCYWMIWLVNCWFAGLPRPSLWRPSLSISASQLPWIQVIEPPGPNERLFNYSY